MARTHKKGSGSGAGSGNGQRTVLVVEDDPNIGMSLRFLMERAGFDVRVVGDGEAALREVDSNRPDVILLDILMPLLDGYAVCQAIRNRDDCCDVRIVMLTARARAEDRERGLDAGADAYMVKPFSTRALVDTVRGLIGG
jgi:DNA-binding response OmpR family regulator